MTLSLKWQFSRKSKSNSNSSGSGSLSIGEDASLKALKEEDRSPENNSGFPVGRAEPGQPSSDPDKRVEIQKSEEAGVEQVVEKQDMEKLEKEEEGKVEKRGRFNIKTDEQKKSEEAPSPAAPATKASKYPRKSKSGNLRFFIKFAIKPNFELS